MALVPANCLTWQSVSGKSLALWTCVKAPLLASSSLACRSKPRLATETFAGGICTRTGPSPLRVRYECSRISAKHRPGSQVGPRRHISALQRFTRAIGPVSSRNTNRDPRRYVSASPGNEYEETKQGSKAVRGSHGV